MTRTSVRPEQAVHRELARSLAYRVLSQCFAYPTEEAVAELRNVDLPQVLEEAAYLPGQLLPLLGTLEDQLRANDAVSLQTEHRRVFSHIMSVDCPPCETVYTTSQIVQEVQELADIRGFFSAFGVELEEKERPDHISVELEFMHLLTYKEAHAWIHHVPSNARLCRGAQRKFMHDHLGRWAGVFAERLRAKANGGFFGAVASLTESFIAADIALLKVRPDVPLNDPHLERPALEEFSCPVSEACSPEEQAHDDEHAD